LEENSFEERSLKASDLTVSTSTKRRINEQTDMIPSKESVKGGDKKFFKPEGSLSRGMSPIHAKSKQ
jgi:hypothetical protein